MNDQQIEEKKVAVNEELEKLKPKLVELATTIHQNPETKFEEVKASKWLSDAAVEAGFKLEKPLGRLETAFRASYSGSKKGPNIAFLGEYDALPDVGHACGHNLIGPAALGAALAMAKHMKDVPGSVQVIGTPGEEGGGGKVMLAEAGVFNKVDIALMYHPSNDNVLWRHSLSRRKLFIEFFGKSSHAAGAPDKGINALDATIQTFNNINALRQYITDDARIHGVILEGGSAPNVIPAYSSSLFYIRALDDDYCDELLERVKNCARGAALATGSEVKLEMQGAYKSLKTNIRLAETFQKNAEALGRTFIDIDPFKRIGSTDTGDVSHKVPAIHPYLAIGPENMAGHTTEFAEASKSPEGMAAMMDAAKAMAATALDILLRPSLFEEIKKEFKG